MAAPRGHDFAVRFKTRAARQRLCDQWCKHLRAGFSKESFPHCDVKTIARYMEKFAQDFPAEKMAAAEREHRLFWERIGVKGAQGKTSNFSAASWVFNMKNRFGWRDKLEHSGDPERPIVVNRIRFDVIDDDIDYGNDAPE